VKKRSSLLIKRLIEVGVPLLQVSRPRAGA